MSDFQFVRIAMAPPIGAVLVVSKDNVLIALDFGQPEERLGRLLGVRFGSDPDLMEVSDSAHAAAVRAYFSGDFKALDTVETDGGGTPFQREVWSALRSIPAGETRSYGEIARQLGKPGAARAVGLANALNPINLVVPCHRVIGSSGALTGYGGGMDRKRWLLDFEASASDDRDTQTAWAF